jgi:hypothetical protein
MAGLLSEQEISKREAEANTFWQEMVDELVENHAGFAEELFTAVELLDMIGQSRVKAVLVSAGMKMCVELWWVERAKAEEEKPK